jgi:uncharacterized membrane protein (UPF0127 family)
MRPQCARCSNLVAIEVFHARRFRHRLLGLMGSQKLPDQAGLFLSACNMIHTFGMSRPIDVVFVDACCGVLQVRRHVGAGRIVGCLRAHSVIELAAGQAWQLGLHEGQRLLLREISP